MILRALSAGLAGMAFLAATQLQPCAARPPELPLNPIVNCAPQQTGSFLLGVGVNSDAGITGHISLELPVPEVGFCECPPYPEYCRYRRELIDCLLMGIHPAAALLPTRLFIQFEGPGFVPDCGLDLMLLRPQVARPQDQVTAGQFKPAGFINNWSGSGIPPAGTFTPDLDIPVVNLEQLTVKPVEVEVLTVPPTEIEILPVIPGVYVPDGGTVIIGARKFLSTGASEPVQRAIGYTSVCEIKRHPRNLEQVLYDPVAINFSEVPLQKAIKEIAKVMEIRIVVDEEALSEEGVNFDHPISMKLEGVSLKSTLKLVLEQARLTYVIKEEFLLVTTRSRAAGPVVKKLYPVEDLLSLWKKAQKPDEKCWTSDRLMELILHTTKATWNIYGGAGTIDFLEASKQLIVCQTAEIHEQIEQFLGALRHEEKNRLHEMLIKVFSQAYKEGDYAKAEQAAKEALDLDPDSCIGNAALTIARKQLFETIPAPKEVREVELKLPSPFYLRHPPQYYPPPPLPSAHEMLKRAQELRERGAAIGQPSPPLPCVPSVEQLLLEEVQRMTTPRLIIEVEDSKEQESYQVPITPGVKRFFVEPTVDLVIEDKKEHAGCCDLLQMVGKKLLGSTCVDIDITAGGKRAQGQLQLGVFTVQWSFASGKEAIDISIGSPGAQESFLQRVARWIEANASAGVEEQNDPQRD